MMKDEAEWKDWKMDREEPGRVVGIALRGVLQYDIHLTHSLQLGRILTALMSGCAEGVVTGCIYIQGCFICYMHRDRHKTCS